MSIIGDFPSKSTYVPTQWPDTSSFSYTYSYPQLSDADVTRIATKMIEILEARGVVFALRAEDV